MNKRLMINFLIIISSILGIISTFISSGFMSSSIFYYYTMQSNILIIIIMLLFITFDLNKIKIPNYLYIIKYIITVGITITFLVFTFMLMPQLIINNNILYLFTISNITLHFLSPILSIISFILFDNIKHTKTTKYYSIIMPLYYLIFSMVLSKISTEGVFNAIDGTRSKVPYFFLDYEKNGWFTLNNGFFGLGTFYWIIIICVLVIIIGTIFLKLKNKVIKLCFIFLFLFFLDYPYKV